MAFFKTQFQIHSDLHLETPLVKPTYTHFSSPSNFPLHASNLVFLGDIGCLKDAGLFTFIRALLSRTPNLKIYYVLGNHEAYGITLEAAIEILRQFEQSSKKNYGDRFFFMEKRRVDLGKELTLLGCTLWSQITEEQAPACARLLTDFQDYAGINSRLVEDHNANFEASIAWLNEQVKRIEDEEPERQIVVLTHHSPTLDSRANNPTHVESNVKSGFVTDLSGERCWRSPNVKAWAFGHTHWNCAYVDSGYSGKKLVVSNQKGYCGVNGQGNWDVQACVIEEGDDGVWGVVDVEDLRDEGRRAGERNRGDDTVVVEGNVEPEVVPKGKERRKSIPAMVKKLTSRD